MTSSVRLVIRHDLLWCDILPNQAV